MLTRPTYEEMEKQVFDLKKVVTEQTQEIKKLTIYQDILSLTTDAIAFLDNEYRYVIVNDSYEDFSGIKRGNFIGQTIAEYLGKDIFENVVKPKFDRCLQGEIINYQAWFEYPKAGRRFVDVTYFPYRFLEKTISGVVANTRNITENKLSKERLQQTLAAANAGIWEWDLKTNKNIWSDELWRLYCLDPNDWEASYESWKHSIHPADRARVAEQVGTASVCGEAFDTTWRVNAPDDRVCWLISFGFPQVDKNGEIVAYRGIVIDITAQKLMETLYQQSANDLKESEEKYRKIFHQAQVAMFRTSISDGTLIDANEEYAKKAGYSTIEECKANFHPGKAWVDQKSREKLKKLLAKNGSVRDYEAEILRGDGVTIWVSISATIYRENGFMEGSIEDITKRKDAIDQLKDINTALDVLLKKRAQENQAIEENIFSNYELMIGPFLNKLKNTASNKNQQNLIDIIETNLKEIVNPFIKKISNPMMSLTQSEIQIATMIKQGFTNKEISQTLNCSKRTIDTHRENIRKKLDLSNKKVNLKTFLLNP